MIETRYISALKEINKKDEFLKDHLTGRSNDPDEKKYVESVLNQYVNSFDSRFALMEQMQLLEQEIKKYNTAL
jgi:hypothetical protein